jgi:hypothetical protein
MRHLSWVVQRCWLFCETPEIHFQVGGEREEGSVGSGLDGGARQCIGARYRQTGARRTEVRTRRNSSLQSLERPRLALMSCHGCGVM